MPTATTALFPPPIRGAIADTLGKVTRTFQQWLFTLQNQSQLKLVDTSAGDYSEDLPAAGLNATTGQSNQNQELIYKKISADGHTFTLTGSNDGPLTLTAVNASMRLRSNGTSWYKV
jgi:hypothetical protein